MFDTRPDLDLDLVDRARLALKVVELPPLLQLLERQVDVHRVILTHPALEVADRRGGGESGLRLGLPVTGEQQPDLRARPGEVDVLVILAVIGRQRVAEDHAGVGCLLLHVILQRLDDLAVVGVLRVEVRVLEDLTGGGLLPVGFGHLERRGDRLAMRVAQELGEIARLGPLGRDDADELHRPGHHLAIDAEVEDAGAFHRRGHSLDVLAGDLLDPRHDLLPVVEAIQRERLDDDVGEHPVQPLLHLVGEPRHDRVDHDHRRDAEHHADDARQRDVPGLQITPAEDVLVHRTASLQGHWSLVIGH